MHIDDVASTCITVNMKFFVFLCCVFAAAPCAVFASVAVGVDHGPIAFALLDNCKQRFKCEVRKLHRIFNAYS
jgi:transcription elongation factor Elf1